MFKKLADLWQSTTEAVVKNWKSLINFGLWLILAVAMTAMGLKEFIPPPPTPFVHLHHGWIDDQEAVEAVSETLNIKYFKDTPAGKADDPLPDHVYLWEAYKKLTGKKTPAKNQRDIGSCVSFGTNNAILRTMAVAIALGNLKGELKDFAEEVTYGGSRVQIGEGRLGRGDGSVGAWAAEFVHKYGIVSRDVHGSHDLREYSVSRCAEFGYKGVPDELLEIAESSPVREITRVTSWKVAKRALANGYGIAVCSNQGFAMKRDSRGVCSPSGRWAHCMTLDGYHTDARGVEYGHIDNSWGPDAHTGPVGWGDPQTSGFWVPSSTINSMLAQGDSWAFSAVVGFPPQPLDWFVQRQDPQERQERSRRLYASLSLYFDGDAHASRN